MIIKTIITENLLIEMHEKSVTIMNRTYADSSPNNTRNQLNMDVGLSIFLEELAWKVLVPILTSITAGIVLDKIRKKKNKKKKNAKKGRSGIPTIVNEHIGKKVIPYQTELIDTCSQEIQKVFKEHGIKRIDANLVVKEILRLVYKIEKV